MHQYMRAIGFTNNPGRKEIYNYIQKGVENPAYRAYTGSGTEENVILAQYDIPTGDGIGISVFGQFDEDDIFYPEYFYPYLDSNRVSSTEEVTVERRLDNESYAGVCDDLRLGLTLVFRLRNTIEYLQARKGENLTMLSTSVSLSALSLEGKVLLPLYHSPQEESRQKKWDNEHRRLMAEARNGNEDAAGELAMQEMNVYANVLTHMEAENDDVYTMVDSCFMPYGTECDLYSVLGRIVESRSLQNNITGEEVCVLTLDCNGLQFNTAINRKDLLGEPAPGRRFKGRIWMMGRINFQNAEAGLAKEA